MKKKRHIAASFSKILSALWTSARICSALIADRIHPAEGGFEVLQDQLENGFLLTRGQDGESFGYVGIASRINRFYLKAVDCPRIKLGDYHHMFLGVIGFHSGLFSKLLLI